MLRTNLSTRPFYNERAVHFVLLILGLVAATVMTLGVYRLVDLSRANTVLTAAANRDEAAASDTSNQTAAIRHDISDDELEGLTLAAQEANRLIDRRVFSWTEFFNRIERTLPPDVMLTSVRPNIESNVITVSMGVVGRDVEHIYSFIEQLEGTGAFTDVLARTEEIIDEGMYRATLVGQYLPDAAALDADAEPASDTPADASAAPADEVSP